MKTRSKNKKNLKSLKNVIEILANKNIIPTFAFANKKNGSLAQLNRASDYGSEGYRFESCANHSKRMSYFKASSCCMLQNLLHLYQQYFSLETHVKKSFNISSCIQH